LSRRHSKLSERIDVVATISFAQPSNLWQVEKRKIVGKPHPQINSTLLRLPRSVPISPAAATTVPISTGPGHILDIVRAVTPSMEQNNHRRHPGFLLALVSDAA
jgi:hypothetical protein